jgi:hypothetical protein
VAREASTTPGFENMGIIVLKIVEEFAEVFLED